jgi:hypothetical protein
MRADWTGCGSFAEAGLLGVARSATLTGFEPAFCLNAYVHVHVRRKSA